MTGPKAAGTGNGVCAHFWRTLTAARLAELWTLLAGVTMNTPLAAIACPAPWRHQALVRPLPPRARGYPRPPLRSLPSSPPVQQRKQFDIIILRGSHTPSAVIVHARWTGRAALSPCRSRRLSNFQRPSRVRVASRQVADPGMTERCETALILSKASTFRLPWITILGSERFVSRHKRKRPAVGDPAGPPDHTAVDDGGRDGVRPAASTTCSRPARTRG